MDTRADGGLACVRWKSKAVAFASSGSVVTFAVKPAGAAPPPKRTSLLPEMSDTVPAT